jgi:AcrR family transcriptional regulator
MRKKPQQHRSRAMVERILDAAAHVLHENGIVDFGTRQVAERAGISVGSLYQYFDHKQALLQALGEHVSQLINQHIQAVIPSLISATPEQFVRIIIESAFEVLDQNEGRYLYLIQHWQQLDIRQDVRQLEQLIIQAIELFSASHPELRNLPQLRRTLYIAVNTVLFNLMRYTSEPSPFFSRGELIDGLVDMLDTYFQKQLHTQKTFTP